MYMKERERLTDFNELAHKIVGARKSKICEVGHRLETQGLCCSSSPEAVGRILSSL